ncbi:hypothetical protein BO70DRAFT_365046 [Aspergillus heteromorphus CBS 117.55]|uniref:Mitotic checkpoint regulator, MAD2B-interacting-domain-containing protein n=1 Tax=Aspergillus heteromorphus CBS 117.55 TaxID=1448321 RepID=A0A317VEX7_9EURO|nr:uncharacterized protein BO70DRAFT_365046 [Aspergillus heteromorphus CBS 117.55]PWY71647.1 hypothetical protein BO70DRAFT_365046 [Aspergillus heteromorphus CBS 117.55]
MALVAYSDSEGSDSEPETTVPHPPSQKPTSTPSTTSTAASTSANFPSIVDRSNPRKILVALPDIKPDRNDSADGPAPKKPRLGGAGGAFSGFNSLLPAPKKPAASAEMKKAPARKIFSLKTGATPGFDRAADAEMRNEQAFGMLGAEGKGGNDGDGDDDETIPKAGSLREDGDGSKEAEVQMKKPEEVKLKGNPMMFKPLSVGRASQQKKRKIVPAKPVSETLPVREQSAPVQQAAPAPAPVKPKISLFSLSAEDSSSTTTASTRATDTTYEPLVYTANPGAAPAGPEPEPEGSSFAEQPAMASGQTLGNIADDLNLSKAQRRHLFGRDGGSATSRVIQFNTDKEYAANQEMAHSTDMAAAQHNPVRAIAPGKHSLQQLVNAAHSQRDALEESFAAGKRNKKEAGSKYGW